MSTSMDSLVSTFWAWVVIPTSLWVFFDASRIGVRKGRMKGLFDMGPLGWTASCLLLWILAFPAYLAKRGDYKAAKNVVASASSLDDLKKLAELKAAGFLNDSEFEEKKKELLARV